MKGSLTDHNQEFQELAGNLSEAVHQISDPVALATMLFSIAEEKKSTNLIIKDINVKFETLVEKFENIRKELEKLNQRIEENKNQQTQQQKAEYETEPSERDKEVLKYISENKRACAEELQKSFNYRGRNAASARLNKLFKEGLLGKVYAGRNVYYTLK